MSDKEVFLQRADDRGQRSEREYLDLTHPASDIWLPSLGEHADAVWRKIDWHTDLVILLNVPNLEFFFVQRVHIYGLALDEEENA